MTYVLRFEFKVVPDIQIKILSHNSFRRPKSRKVTYRVLCTNLIFRKLTAKHVVH